MIIIADSGSTKCDWIVLNENWEIVNHIKTMGFNPYFHNEILISNVLKRDSQFIPLSPQVSQVYFYGAGCSNKYFCSIVERSLEKVFTNAKISVDHDLMACALATYQDEPAISCILGTGSNSCYFDGEKLQGGNPSLGFIVGDEGSGSYFGKKLLRSYFYKQMPHKISKEFEDLYKLKHIDFSKNVYENNQANVFLASFMQFISDRRENPFFQKILHEGFYSFLKYHVACFPNHKEVKTHFVGSLSYFFSEEITAIAETMQIETGQFIQKPIFGLIEYQKSRAKIPVTK